MKRWTYIIGVIALGFVIFNNVIQTSKVIQTNSDYMIGFAVSMIVSLGYGIINIKN